MRVNRRNLLKLGLENSGVRPERPLHEAERPSKTEGEQGSKLSEQQTAALNAIAILEEEIEEETDTTLKKALEETLKSAKRHYREGRYAKVAHVALCRSGC